MRHRIRTARQRPLIIGRENRRVNSSAMFEPSYLLPCINIPEATGIVRTTTKNEAVSGNSYSVHQVGMPGQLSYFFATRSLPQIDCVKTTGSDKFAVWRKYSSHDAV